ncbi:MAG: hypothetical protein OXT65_08755 [Alphaproteobacteria bacterium]|nr:hypothetical protein [Alphaproteobacteria bacterium]
MHDIVSNLGIAQVLAPQTIQASALDSGDIDTQGTETLAVAILVGEIADTLDASNRIDLTIEHADDDGTGSPGSYSDCTDDDVLNFTSLSSGVFESVDDAAKENKRHVIGYRGGKRFVKVTATPVSLATGGPVAMMALTGNLAQKPADNS